MADKPKWITVNGTHIPVGKDGDLQGRIGKKEKPIKEQNKSLYQTVRARASQDTCLRRQSLGSFVSAWELMQTLKKY